MSTHEQRALAPIEKIRAGLTRMEPQLKELLPAHIKVERFNLVVMTAVHRRLELLEADAKSLFDACQQCAQDGLLPDGREATLNVYKTKVQTPDGEKWVKKVQYLPMISGIRKKAHEAGTLSDWVARIVYANDQFEIVLGDDERIVHKPAISNRGKPVCVYSIATLKDGSKSRDWMTIDEVNRIRSRSKSPDKGPWATDYDEMAKKTVAKRHAKVLQLTPALDRILRRIDDLYDLEQKPAQVAGMRAQKRLAAIRTLDDVAATAADAEIIEPNTPIAPANCATSKPEREPPADNVPPRTAGGSPSFLDRARAEGRADHAKRVGIRAVPVCYRTSKELAGAWRRGWMEAEEEAQQSEAEASQDLPDREAIRQ